MKGIYDCFACGVTVYANAYQKKPSDLLLWSTKEPDGLWCFSCFLDYWNKKIGTKTVCDTLTYVRSMIDELVDAHFETYPHEYQPRKIVKNNLFQSRLIWEFKNAKTVVPHLAESHRILESLFK